MRSQTSPRGNGWGTEDAELSVVFNTDGGPKRYSPASAEEFSQYTIGSRWTLSLNAVGAVLDVRP